MAGKLDEFTVYLAAQLKQAITRMVAQSGDAQQRVQLSVIDLMTACAAAHGKNKSHLLDDDAWFSFLQHFAAQKLPIPDFKLCKPWMGLVQLELARVMVVLAELPADQALPLSQRIFDLLSSYRQTYADPTINRNEWSVTTLGRAEYFASCAAAEEVCARYKEGIVTEAVKITGAAQAIVADVLLLLQEKRAEVAAQAAEDARRAEAEAWAKEIEVAVGVQTAQARLTVEQTQAEAARLAAEAEALKAQAALEAAKSANALRIQAIREELEASGVVRAREERLRLIAEAREAEAAAARLAEERLRGEREVAEEGAKAVAQREALLAARTQVVEQGYLDRLQSNQTQSPREVAWHKVVCSAVVNAGPRVPPLLVADVDVVFGWVVEVCKSAPAAITWLKSKWPNKKRRNILHIFKAVAADCGFANAPQLKPLLAAYATRAPGLMPGLAKEILGDLTAKPGRSVGQQQMAALAMGLLTEAAMKSDPVAADYITLALRQVQGALSLHRLGIPGLDGEVGLLHVNPAAMGDQRVSLVPDRHVLVWVAGDSIIYRGEHFWGLIADVEAHLPPDATRQQRLALLEGLRLAVVVPDPDVPCNPSQLAYGVDVQPLAPHPNRDLALLSLGAGVGERTAAALHQLEPPPAVETSGPERSGRDMLTE